MSNLKNQIAQVAKNKEAKVLASNFAWLTVLKIVGYVFPLITMPYLAKVIGPEGFGKVAFAGAIMVWMQTIADWGFHFTATRDIAKCRDDKAQVSLIFSDVLWSRILLMLCSLALLVVLVFTIPKFKENALVIFISFLMVPGHILFPDWFFQAIEKMKYITILNLISKLVFTIAIFVFIKEKNDYILQPLMTSLGYVVAGVVAMYVILKKWGYKIHKPSFSRIKDSIKSSSDVFLNNLFPNLYASFSTILLGVFCGSTANGIYDAGLKFAQIAEQIVQVVSRTFFPFLSRRIEKHSLYVKLSMAVTVAMASVLFFGAPLLIRLFFTPEFCDAVLVLRILSLMIVAISISNIYGTNYMIIQGYERKLRNITLICSIAGFLLAFPLIYYFSYIGKAVLMVIANGMLGLWSMVFVNRVKNKANYEQV